MKLKFVMAVAVVFFALTLAKVQSPGWRSLAACGFVSSLVWLIIERGKID
jgi:uncharacterized membrane protein YjjB (DUF3815 family)